MPDFTDPQVWWFLTRASAIVAWVLMTLAVVWGILLKTRILRGADNPEWLKTTHRYISFLSVSMIVTHMATLWLDNYVEFTVADLLIPFSSSFEPVAVALGVFAFWFVILVQLTALGSKWLPERVWKSVHLSSYLSLALVMLHSGMVGTDVGQTWYTVLSLILITTATLAGVIRLIIAGRPTPQRAVGNASQPLERTPAKKDTFTARVISRQEVGESLVVITLEPVDSSVEPEWDAGAHLTLHLGNGLERQYSLAGDPASPRTLVLGVLNTRGPGGGSTWLHDNLYPGVDIECDFPRNAFPMKPAHRYQFIASGVGITTVHSMLSQVPASREWSLLYLGRKRDDMLFVDELEARWGQRVTTWISEEQGGRADLEAFIDPMADVYVCGSDSVMKEIENLVAPKRFHAERFQPVERKSVTGIDEFEVIAQKSNVTVKIGQIDTVLEKLEDAGVSLNASCRRGTCGACELTVVDGVPEHLDSVMADHDKDDAGIFFPCVSRSHTQRLVLDV